MVSLTHRRAPSDVFVGRSLDSPSPDSPPSLGPGASVVAHHPQGVLTTQPQIETLGGTTIEVLERTGDPCRCL